jgi:hypothetical protein
MAKKHPKIKKLIYVVLFPFSDFFFLQKNPKITKLIYVVLFPFRIKNFANSTTLPTPPTPPNNRKGKKHCKFLWL